MRATQWLLVAVALIIVSGSVQAQPDVSPRPLRNNDILRLLEDKVATEIIISRILTSSCNFDTFPPVMRDLRRRGVPEKILHVMKVVPYGPPNLADVDSQVTALPRVEIPEGTLIEVETATATSSGRVKEGDLITFLAKRQVFINNVLIIDRGAVAKAKVVKVRRASAFGRAGMLAWQMDYIVAVDGTRIPINLSGKQTGANRTAAMAGGAVATGALVFPYTSPVALIWGLKKGDEAVLRGSKVFAASVGTKTEIAGIQPRPGGVVYRDRETVKASAAPPTKTSFEQGFRRKPNRQ